MCLPSISCLLFSLGVGGRHLKDGLLDEFELGLDCTVFSDAFCWLRLDSIHLSSLGFGHL